jgi:RNA polymerase sigma-70 factor (ECF subfamily)
MSFEAIYQTYYQKVFRLCMGYVNDDDWAKDLTQETFITVWQKLGQFRGESAVGTWIFRIAVNTCLRQLEKSKRIAWTDMRFHLEEKPHEETEIRMRLLYQCISELREIDRLIISLELEDLPQAEIAAIVGLAETNVRVRIHRIKQKLSQKFKEYEQSNRS